MQYRDAKGNRNAKSKILYSKKDHLKRTSWLWIDLPCRTLALYQNSRFYVLLIAEHETLSVQKLVQYDTNKCI